MRFDFTQQFLICCDVTSFQTSNRMSMTSRKCSAEHYSNCRYQRASWHFGIFLKCLPVVKHLKHLVQQSESVILL
jgi:hypothetical protein